MAFLVPSRPWCKLVFSLDVAETTTISNRAINQMKIIATSPEYQGAADVANKLFDYMVKRDPQYMERVKTEAEQEMINQLIWGKEPSEGMPGIALLTPSWLSKAFGAPNQAKTFILYGDGEHDDADALQAWLDGKRVTYLDGSLVGDTVQGNRLLISKSIDATRIGSRKTHWQLFNVQ